MSAPADFRLEQRDGERVAALTGEWTAVDMAPAESRLASALAGQDGVILDLSGVSRCDTSGAYAVLRAAGLAKRPGRIIAPPAVERMLELVRAAERPLVAPKARVLSVGALFDRIGHGVVDIGLSSYDSLVFNGHLLVAVGRAIGRPHKVRWAAVFALAERAGLDAIPIIAVTAFFIGAVIALLGANQLANFGARVFTVDLVGIAVFREFNILITALLLAGRSASSFAAEIGAMKMNQEIDAMQILGIDSFDALVLPRFLALLLTIPLLTFVATLAGLLGGLLVAWWALEVSPNVFFERLVDNVGATHFWVGMSKAPVMAVIIASIGCRQGLEVGGDVESLGRRVTAAVVQAIFAAILIDAIFALIYMKLNI
jgi:phospholipid/cholesterol/gamma-HCH transport system permease protein